MTESNRSEREDPRPGFKWPVGVAHPIAATPEKVWDVISMPGNLELCHPFCAKNPVEAWPGGGSRDEIHYLSGWVYERRFCRWIDGVGYDLTIGRHGGQTSFVSWRIIPLNIQSCLLRITIYPYDVVWLAPKLRRYLSSVIRGFEWYVIRGEAVPRNQFGTHPWFSIP
jgi:hypothetical protein